MFRTGNPKPELGQPRPDGEKEARVPSAAERVRTLVEGNSSAVLAIPGLPAASGAAAPALTPPAPERYREQPRP